MKVELKETKNSFGEMVNHIFIDGVKKASLVIEKDAVEVAFLSVNNTEIVDRFEIDNPNRKNTRGYMDTLIGIVAANSSNLGEKHAEYIRNNRETMLSNDNRCFRMVKKEGSGEDYEKEYTVLLTGDCND